MTMRLNAAGFIRGDYFAPAVTGLTELRLVTQDGDDSTSAVLGMVTALAYIRTDPTSLCPDVPPPAATDCALPVGVLVGVDFSEVTTYIELDDWLFVGDYWVENGYLWNVYWNLFLDFSPTPDGYALVDLDNTFNGNPSLYLYPFFVQYAAGMYGDYFAGALDVSFMQRFRLESYTVSGGGFDYFIHIHYNGGGANIVQLLVEDGDRIALEYRTGPGSYAHVDLGPATDILDRDVEVICRVQTLSAALLKYSVYIHDVCTEPVLYYETTFTNRTGNAAAVWTGNDRWYGGGLGDPTPSGLRIYQEAVATDPTVFGIPA